MDRSKHKPRSLCLGRLFSFIIALLMLAGLTTFVVAQTVPATLVSDKSDYVPYEIAVLSGAGFLPGESIDLSISIDDPATGTHISDYDWTQFNADANGGFVVGYEVPPEAEGMTLIATAMGLSSGLIARTTFTDSNIGVHNVNFKASGLLDGTVINIAGTSPAPGGSHNLAPFNQSFTTPNASANVGSTLSNVTIGAHTHGSFTFTFSGFPTSVPGIGGTYNLTSIAITAGSAAGTVTNFSANISTGGGSFTTGSAANTGMGGTPTTVTGTYTFVPTVTNYPPSIVCLDPTAQLGKVIGLLSGNSFSATIPISYSFSGGSVKAAFGFTSGDVIVVVATVTDPEGDALTVNTLGPSSVVLTGPGAVNALLSFLTGQLVNITANDGNNPDVVQNCDLTVNASIIYDFVGFGAPLSDVDYPITRMVKRGSSVPTKFRLYDAAGTEICTDLGAGPHEIAVYYYSGAAPSGDPTITDSGTSNDNTVYFRYSGTCGVDGNWIYNLKTNTSYYLNSTYEIEAMLNDGETYDTYISTK